MNVQHIQCVLCSFLFFLCVQGVKPGSFDKVAIPEVKEIIDGCIRTNKDERWEKPMLCFCFSGILNGLCIITLWDLPSVSYFIQIIAASTPSYGWWQTWLGVVKYVWLHLIPFWITAPWSDIRSPLFSFSFPLCPAILPKHSPKLNLLPLLHFLCFFHTLLSRCLVLGEKTKIAVFFFKNQDKVQAHKLNAMWSTWTDVSGLHVNEIMD